MAESGMMQTGDGTETIVVLPEDTQQQTMVVQVTNSYFSIGIKWLHMPSELCRVYYVENWGQ